MVPDGWGVHKLEDIAKYRRGSFPQPYGLDKWFDDDGHSFVQVYDVDTNLKLKDVTKAKISDLAVEKSVLAPRGTVLVTLQGSIGRVAITQYPAYVDRTLLIIKELKLEGDLSYLAISLQELFAEEKKRAPGGTIKTITKAALNNFKIFWPPRKEQQKIAKILSTWDEAIATTEQLLANSEQQKKALMQQLLTGKKRLPGFEGEWRQLSLTDIGDISSAGVDKKSDKNEMKVRLLNYLDVFRKEFIFNQELQHEVTAPDAKIASCDVRKGDVFFTPSSETRDELAFPAVACETMPGVVYSYHVVRLRPKIKLDLNFSAYLFQTREFKRQAYRAGDGSGQRYVISQKAFRRMEVSVPSISEQEAIGRVLRAASDEIIELSQELDFLIEEKKALMQQLLTGKRRVKVDEAERATA